jgi:hypothetical protein
VTINFSRIPLLHEISQNTAVKDEVVLVPNQAAHHEDVRSGGKASHINHDTKWK